MVFLRRATPTIVAAIVLAALIGCEHGPMGPEGPALKGTLTGFAVLVNANGDQPARKDSVMVMIGDSRWITYTDSTGYWSIPWVETGIYDIVFMKNGYADNKLVQVQFTGGGKKDVGNVFLCQVPGFSVKQLSKLTPIRTDSTTLRLAVQLTDSTITGPFMPYRVFLFLGTDSSVSSDPNHYVSEILFTMQFKKGVDSNTIRIAPATFATNGFAAGDQVYIAAYTANAGNNNSAYLDPGTGRIIYNNINGTRSNVLKVLVASDTSGPAGNGYITGFVDLVKVNGGRPPVRDSVTVSIDSSAFKTMTDSSGAWTIPNLGAGTYDFTFSKPV